RTEFTALTSYRYLINALKWAILHNHAESISAISDTAITLLVKLGNTKLDADLESILLFHKPRLAAALTKLLQDNKHNPALESMCAPETILEKFIDSKLLFFGISDHRKQVDGYLALQFTCKRYYVGIKQVADHLT